MPSTYEINYDDEDKAMGVNGQYFFIFKRSDEIFYMMGQYHLGEDEYQIIIPDGVGNWLPLPYFLYSDFIRMHGFDPKTRKRVC